MSRIKKKQFKLEGKKFFLTYHKLDPSIQFIQQRALNKFLLKFKNLKFYLISEEEHEDGKIHLYCYFEFIKPIIKSTHFFNLVLDGVSYSGNCRIGKPEDKILQYLVKEGNYSTNMVLPFQGKTDDLLLPLDEFDQLQAITRWEIRQWMKKDLTPNFNWLSYRDYFKIYRLLSSRSNSVKFREILILYGSEGSGKDILAKSIFKELKIKPVIINKLSDLYNYNSLECRGILIDARFNSSSESSENWLDDNCLYDFFFLDLNIPRIILTNECEPENFDFIIPEDNEVKRILVFIRIYTNVLSQFKFNSIQNNPQPNPIDPKKNIFKKFKEAVQKILKKIKL